MFSTPQVYKRWLRDDGGISDEDKVFVKQHVLEALVQASVPTLVRSVFQVCGDTLMIMDALLCRRRQAECGISCRKQ